MDKSTQAGVGFMGLLFVVFLVLKLTKVISWSWWWVTVPLWGPVAITLLLLIIMFLYLQFNLYRSKRLNGKRK